MKKLSLLLLAITATLLSGVRAHALVNLMDPSSRADHSGDVHASASSCETTQPCISCSYNRV